MNKTGDLVEIIKEFICKPKKDKALLINGEWGSGKTFFMQNLSEREISPASDKKIYTFLGNYLHFKFKKFKKIYISLKGINSLEEIADTIVKGILFKSKKMYILLHVSLFVGFIVVLISVSYFIGKYIGIDISVFCTVVIAALGIFGRIEFKKNLLNSFFDWEDFSNYLFIFDDLERLPEKFSYADVLLYIHSLLLDNKDARKNANVIFVADTSKLFISNRKELEKGGKNNKSGAENAEPGTSQKLSGNTEKELEEKERYYNAKEKVIEREVVFEQSLKDIFNSYIEYRYDYLDAGNRNFIKTNKKINEIIKKFDVKNFRNYNSFFDALVKIYTDKDFQKIINKVHNSLKDILLDEILVYLSIVYIYY